MDDGSVLVSGTVPEDNIKKLKTTTTPPPDQHFLPSLRRVACVGSDVLERRERPEMRVARLRCVREDDYEMLGDGV